MAFVKFADTLGIGTVIDLGIKDWNMDSVSVKIRVWKQSDVEIEIEGEIDDTITVFEIKKVG